MKRIQRMQRVAMSIRHFIKLQLAAAKYCIENIGAIMLKRAPEFSNVEKVFSSSKILLSEDSEKLFRRSIETKGMRFECIQTRSIRMESQDPMFAIHNL